MKDKMLKNVMNYMQEMKEKASRLIYDKEYCELQLAEIQQVGRYVHDVIQPEWRPINMPGYERTYEISNTGDIRNRKNKKIMAQKTNMCGYKMINLSVDGKCKTITIHRYVALTFLPNPDDCPVVNHINGKKSFNWVGNLEWCTYKENTAHAIRSGIMKSVGVDNPNNKYSEDDIRRVCELLEQGYEGTAIEKMTGVPSYVTHNIKSGEQWSHISKDYNIPKPVDRRVSDDIKQCMIELIFAGYSNREILDYVGFEYTPNKMEYVGLFRRRLLKRSSTIESVAGKKHPSE